MMFWGLDSFYLSRERILRKLYDEVRLLNEVDIDFSMNTKHLVDSSTTLTYSITSRTLVPFYGTILLSILFVAFVL